jgi:hypothetical protein
VGAPAPHLLARRGGGCRRSRARDRLRAWPRCKVGRLRPTDAAAIPGERRSTCATSRRRPSRPVTHRQGGRPVRVRDGRQDVDGELVRDHLTSELVSAAVDCRSSKRRSRWTAAAFGTSSCSPDRRSSASSRCATSSAAGRATEPRARWPADRLSAPAPAHRRLEERHELLHRRTHGPHGRAQHEPGARRWEVLQAQLGEQPRLELRLYRSSREQRHA